MQNRSDQTLIMGQKCEEESRTIKKIQTKHHLKNEEGETLRQLDEIEKEYAKYYKALLKANRAIASEE